MGTRSIDAGSGQVAIIIQMKNVNAHIRKTETNKAVLSNKSLFHEFHTLLEITQLTAALH